MSFKYQKISTNSNYDVEQSSQKDGDMDNLGLRLRSTLRSWGTISLLTVPLFISLGFNLWLIFWRDGAAHSGEETRSCNSPEFQRSPYTDLAFDVPVPYFQNTEYNSENQTLSDEMWESLSLDGMVIAPTNEWIQEKGLPESWPFPWDPSNRRIYFLKVYHHIHCLRILRRSFKKLGSGQGNYTEMSHHVEHCLDTLRQDLMCKADDTPMPSLKHFNGAGEGQIMKCKSLERLFAWAKHPDRDACYKRLSEFDPPSNTIERYAFCSPDSQYFPIMTQYFEEYGQS